MAATLALHGVLLVAVLSYAPVRRAIHNAAPIMVSLISTPAVEKPVEPPKPLPMRATSKPVPLSPIDPVPAPLITPPTQSAFVALISDAPKPQPDAPAAPVELLAIVPPNFNAAYLDNPAPAYPPLARRIGEQGRVVLRVLVTAGGAAETVELRTSSGSSRLDQAAIETVKRWRFVPARQGDLAVPAWVLVPITFSLER
ncbi:MAG: TonB family protein [Betaproteobacteria bacterium]